MVLEATMIVVDNSESARNGDYQPTRFGAQKDAVSLIFNAKTGPNPESSVGLMSMAGSGPEVLTTLTTDMGKVLGGLHRTIIKGHAHFSTGIKIAALALKHRQNKSQRQRIIVFTCSPIYEEPKTLVDLARRMKKNNVNIDVISFGEPEDETVDKLRRFNEAVNGAEGSFFQVIPPSPNLLSDTLLSTTLLQQDGVSGGGAGADGAGGDGAPGGGDTQYEFGVNPDIDPELALALRMSMEEEKARVEREQKKQEEEAKKGKLEGISEEKEGEATEKEPLLGEQGESSEGKKDEKKDNGDKMDTV